MGSQPLILTTPKFLSSPNAKRLLAMHRRARMHISQEALDKELALFETERDRVPELFERAPMIDYKDTLRSVGIDDGEGEKPLAYLKLLPQYFVVEEVDREGAIHDVAPGTLFG